MRILFLCVGNACRSQMAEGFARARGKDLVEAASAGFVPMEAVPPQTIQSMSELGIDISGQSSKGASEVKPASFDLIVNMSGIPLNQLDPRRVRTWDVPDPFGKNDAAYRQTREVVERLVDELLAEVRGLRQDFEQRRNSALTRRRAARGIDSAPPDQAK
jgi:arsenate reductase